MAKLIEVAANKQDTHVLMNINHVRIHDGEVVVELPFFDEVNKQARGVYLVFSKQEALEFAARVVSNVSRAV